MHLASMFSISTKSIEDIFSIGPMSHTRAAWDLPHHLWGNPIWPFMRTSSFGCVIFDALIAIWFLAGAQSVIRRRSEISSHSVEQPMRQDHCLAAAKAGDSDLR